MSETSAKPKLPPINLNIGNNVDGKSVPVIVNVEDLISLHVGCYLHHLKRWELEQIDFPIVENEFYIPNVIEWWPMPIVGTGNKTTTP